MWELRAQTAARPMSTEFPESLDTDSAFAIVADEEGNGRGIRFDKDIKEAGELVGTFDSFHDALLTKEFLKTNCHRCLKRIGKSKNARKKRKTCSACHHVKYCSQACMDNDSKIHELECVSFQRAEPNPLARLVLRTITLETLKMEKSEWIQALTSGGEVEIEQIVVPNLSAMLPSLPVPFLTQRTRQVQVNCFNRRDLVGSSLFGIPSLINHSCHPNLMDQVSGAMELITYRPVAKGEYASISYLSSTWTTPGSFRLKQLKRSWAFDCACPPCQCYRTLVRREHLDRTDVRAEAFKQLCFKCPHCSGPYTRDHSRPKGHPGHVWWCIDCGYEGHRPKAASRFRHRGDDADDLMIPAELTLERVPSLHPQCVAALELRMRKVDELSQVDPRPLDELEELVKLNYATFRQFIPAGVVEPLLAQLGHTLLMVHHDMTIRLTDVAMGSRKANASMKKSMVARAKYGMKLQSEVLAMVSIYMPSLADHVKGLPYSQIGQLFKRR
eukprot:gnl/Dysnectes_brevis/1002_a1117_1832.p1 GENE.gnl/Dysnectes_brevis/1002_a1117_1832~~gnl/Dysnectes_brevis/1002_a1117_1832.p1  ORF type:complete len:500 (-),score=138.81 gnl/Dysnectes_brevis/1002_a1117_1832:27-1526(-)